MNPLRIFLREQFADSEPLLSDQTRDELLKRLQAFEEEYAALLIKRTDATPPMVMRPKQLPRALNPLYFVRRSS